MPRRSPRPAMACASLERPSSLARRESADIFFFGAEVRRGLKRCGWVLTVVPALTEPRIRHCALLAVRSLAYDCRGESSRSASGDGEQRNRQKPGDDRLRFYASADYKPSGPPRSWKSGSLCSRDASGVAVELKVGFFTTQSNNRGRRGSIDERRMGILLTQTSVPL